jgi:hypothetical protein
MKHLILITVLATLLLSACSVRKYNQTVTAKPEYGLLKLVGAPAGRQVFLEGQPVNLDPEREANIFQLQEGTYRLEIKKAGVSVYDRKVMITTAQTTEVVMP